MIAVLEIAVLEIAVLEIAVLEVVPIISGALRDGI
jgi:hypothetical protein